jgi:two-component system OmpR family sensor kinase
VIRPMSLRLRLALGLGLLLVVGLAAFGIATYSFYTPTQFAQLDSQLRESSDVVSLQLEQKAHVGGGSVHDGPDGENHPPPRSGRGPDEVLAPGSYAALYSPEGHILKSYDVLRKVGVPKLPTKLGPAKGPESRFITVASKNSTGPQWRVLITGAAGAPGYVLALAEPTTAVQAALHHLLLLEAEVALVLFALLLAGSWVILRRGLRPLEHMAHDSRAIAEGDLSRRVGPDKGPTEILELGAALNAMLADIERAFAERDVTEARLRQFLADVSHELRTPLTSIKGYAELFRLSVTGSDSSSDPVVVARRIEDESGRMKRLVDDLLLLARLDQAPEMQREPFDLSVVVADACSAAAATDPDRPITLDAAEPVMMVGDRNHLVQAVSNLLSNALHHTPAGTPIDVSVAEGPITGEATLAVRDHGTGLDDRALAHVFDRFWQADQSRAGGGAGLGLSIVSAIATEHGGSVMAANADGGGAQFVMRLPTPEPDEVAKSAAVHGGI